MNIQIQTTTICNAKCVLCPYHGSWLSKNPFIMSDNTFNCVIDRLKKVKNIGRICMYLMNEPFTDNKIVSRIAQVYDQLSFNHIEISTNALLLSQNTIDNLSSVLRGRPYDFIVSVQGASFKQHQEMMQIDPKKVWENLRYLNRFIDFRIQGCGVPEIFKNNAVCFYNKENYVDYVKRNMGQSFSKILFFAYNDRGGSIKNSYSCMRTREDCSRLHNWIHITYNGDITLCCVDYNREYLFGSILDYDNPEDYHKTKKFKEFLIKFYKQDKSLKCYNCNMV